MDESLNLQLFLKATQRDYLPQHLQIWQGGWMCLCLFALFAGKLNPWNRWIEGWPPQNYLIATHKSQIPDRCTWLKGQTPFPTGSLTREQRRHFLSQFIFTCLTPALILDRSQIHQCCYTCCLLNQRLAEIMQCTVQMTVSAWMAVPLSNFVHLKSKS